MVRTSRVSEYCPHLLQHGSVGNGGTLGTCRRSRRSTLSPVGGEKSELGIASLPQKRLGRWHQSARPPELSALHRIRASGRSRMRHSAKAQRRNRLGVKVSLGSAAKVRDQQVFGRDLLP